MPASPMDIWVDGGTVFGPSFSTQDLNGEHRAAASRLMSLALLFGRPGERARHKSSLDSAVGFLALSSEALPLIAYRHETEPRDARAAGGLVGGCQHMSIPASREQREMSFVPLLCCVSVMYNGSDCIAEFLRASLLMRSYVLSVRYPRMDVGLAEWSRNDAGTSRVIRFSTR